MKKITTLILIIISIVSVRAQFPNPSLVGYWQNWSSMKLSEIHPNYNVIELAFATTKSGTDYDMEFNLPYGYSKTEFLKDIDDLHADGKVIILSIGGASDPVILDSDIKTETFINSINAIFSAYDYKFDGIDLDLESTSLHFGTWTMDTPAQGQTNIIDAVKAIKSNFQLETGKRLYLTMAPETVYLQGALSDWQVKNINGGAYLPIVDALMDDLDLLCPQYYNAGGAQGGTFANNGLIYFDTGDPDYIVALTETLIEGFTIKASKGKFNGISPSKLAIGLPANDCNAAGTGYITDENLCNAIKYLRGYLSKPGSFDYTLNNSYPSLRGTMTWSINEDALSCSGAWSFANNFDCYFDEITAVNSPPIETKIRCYPNPISQGDILHLEVTDAIDLELIDSQGNVVFRSSINSTTYDFDTKVLTPSIYLMKINGVETQKILVE